MSLRAEMDADKRMWRDRMAQRVADACRRAGIRVVLYPEENVLVLEDAHGTQYTVTVSRRRNRVSLSRTEPSSDATADTAASAARTRSTPAE